MESKNRTLNSDNANIKNKINGKKKAFDFNNQRLSSSKLKSLGF